MRRVPLLLLLLALGRTGWPQEPAPPPQRDPPKEKVELQECVPPPLDNMEQFYEVNPTVRNLYYAYLRRGIPHSPRMESITPEVLSSRYFTSGRR